MGSVQILTEITLSKAGAVISCSVRVIPRSFACFFQLPSLSRDLVQDGLRVGSGSVCKSCKMPLSSGASPAEVGEYHLRAPTRRSPGPPVAAAKFQQFSGSLFRRGRILAGHQLAIDKDERSPVRSFLIESAVCLEHVFHQERHDIGEAHRFFLGIGESGDAATGDQGLAIRGQRVLENGRRMTDRADGAVTGGECLDQRLLSASSARSHSGPWPPG